MNAQRGITLSAQEVDFAAGAIKSLRESLEQHASWLKNHQGIPLPGTGIAISEINSEVCALLTLELKLMKTCFSFATPNDSI